MCCFSRHLFNGDYGLLDSYGAGTLKTDPQLNFVQVIYDMTVFNPKTTVQRPCGPHNFFIRASKVNIGIQEPMVPSPTKQSSECLLCYTLTYLGSMPNPEEVKV